MSKDSHAVHVALLGMDGALAKAGVPPMSEYWRQEVKRFYEHPTARLLVECVGRAGDKSRTSVKMSIAEVVTGDFQIAPGEVHYFTHVSATVQEASKTMTILEKYLGLLKLPFTRAGDTIELTGRSRGFKVLAARVSAVSGYRSIGFTLDEFAKLSNDGSDPSAEIAASCRAMCVTHDAARGRMFSSPLAKSGYFYDCWILGDSEYQLAGHAASWVANESITEARTKALEPHEPTRLREYAAIPSAGVSDALVEADVIAMVRPIDTTAKPLGQAVVIIDSSKGAGDGWSYCVARYMDEGGARRLYVDRLFTYEGKFAQTTTFDQVVEHIAAVARRVGARRVFGDQYQAFALASAFAKYGLAYEERAWSLQTKLDATSTLRRLLRERVLVCEPGPEAQKLVKECMLLEEKILASGALTISARRSASGHADRASLLLMLACIESLGDIFGSPTMQYTLGAARFSPVATRWQGGFDNATPGPEVATNPLTNAAAVMGRPAVVHGAGARQEPRKGGWTVS